MGELSAFGPRPAPPWAGRHGLSAVLNTWRGSRATSRNIVLDHTAAAQEKLAKPIPEALHPNVANAMMKRGFDSLYSHQAQAFELASAGTHVVVATPTASGKSLCYNLPVLDRLAREADARALYLFPTKALSRDQEHALRGLMRDAQLDHGAITYDGDTPGDARRAARERSGILLSNPDMLHAGILPHHASWARFFANLRYVVLDELHTYRGVFGSHLANVMRRLKRIAAFHGANPTFLFASATIGNPEEHASNIIGEPVGLIDQSGAPRGERHVLVYNPPIVNPELGIRKSYVKTAVGLTCDLVRAKVPTIVFGQSRNQVETMLKYLRDRLVADKVDPDSIQAYRGGYLANTRRRIENGLRDGSVSCVVSTNALELGIDIGSLDAVVCAGYPGTLASLWQRFGRGGRRDGDSLALLVTSSKPLDQYVARDAAMIVGAPVEQARIDPDNVEILVQHLKCGAFELPFEEGEPFGDVPAPAVGDALDFLAQHSVVHASPGPGGKQVWHWATDAYPASHVSLRSLSWDNFVIIDLDTDKNFAEMDWRSTHTMLHVQAIYQHEGGQYQVEELDFENHKAYVRRVEPDYFTTAMVYTNVTVLQEDDAAFISLPPGSGVATGVGEVSVVEKVVGYKKIKFHTHENVGYGEVRLPEMQMHTTAFWMTVDEDTVRAMDAPRALVIDGLRGIGNAMHTIAAAGLMTDPRDIGHTIGDRGDGGLPRKGRGAGGFDPTLFLYDHIPGGVGLAPRLFTERETLIRRTRSMIEGCPCDEGCPACIGPGAPDPRTLPGGDRTGSPDPANRKHVALELLTRIGVAPTH